MKRFKSGVNVWFFITILNLTIFAGCSLFGPTKPNKPYPGPYPVGFQELFQKNPLLAQELGKLPELQDGISEAEASVLEDIVDIYNEDSAVFDKAFEKMYKVGIPEVRKYCSPLQALFWLVQQNIEKLKQQLGCYDTKTLIRMAWNTYDRGPFLVLSENEIKRVLDGIKDEKERKHYYSFLNRREVVIKWLLVDYNQSPTIFSKEARAIIKNSMREDLYWRQRWKDPKQIIDRLNSPELLDFYINTNIRYAHYIPAFHRSPRSVIKENYGDCDDLAYFGRTVLTKAGYDVFGRVVGDETIRCHIGLGIRLEDGSYFLAVDFNGVNHMSGPYKTLLELDRALGYGTRFHGRGPFFFDW